MLIPTTQEVEFGRNGPVAKGASDEQQRSQRILVVMRWLLVGAVFFVINYHAGTGTAEQVALNLIALVDGFDNPNFLLYFPALLAFTLVFPGWWSFLYCLAVILAYLFVILFTHAGFDGGDSVDVKDLVLRLVTLASTVLLANMVVQIERRRRERAVAAERAASQERQRIAEEIHDGVSQNVYMLAINLEALAEAEGRADAGPWRAEQISGMVQLAKETLIATRGLLTDLHPLEPDNRRLLERASNQAREFPAVTGIPVCVAVDGSRASWRRVRPARSTVFCRRAWRTSTNMRTRQRQASSSPTHRRPSRSNSLTTGSASMSMPSQAAMA